MRKKHLGVLLAVTLVLTLLGFPQVGEETKETLFSSWLYAQTQSTSPPDYDLIIRGGKLIDGTGNPWFYGDVAIRGERIAKVGRVGEKAQRIIDAKGMVVSPGFIDMHSHSDITLPVDGNAESKIRQGVTTEIFGEHLSMAPLCSLARQELENFSRQYNLTFDWEDFNGYFARLFRQGISVNAASYVGAGQVRLCVIGAENRTPTDQELQAMKTLVEDAMRQGAFGLSTGLIYTPNNYASTEELVELARVAAHYGGRYASHLRSEGDQLLPAIREAITIGEMAQTPVHIFHLKALGKENWQRMPQAIALIEEARKRGIEISADQYPYIAAMTGLTAVLPPWVREGGTESMLARLKEQPVRERLRQEMGSESADWDMALHNLGSWDNVLIASVANAKNKAHEGKSIADVARLRGQNPTDTVFDLLLEENGAIGAIYFVMTEENVRYALPQPWVSIGSDGAAVNPVGVLGQGKPHPRWYGTFPRVLGKYVREEKVLTLEDAIRKMTSLAAQQMGIHDRGVLGEGMYADVVVFDAEHVTDKATFTEPHQYPTGIEYVIVNGKVVIEQSKHTGARPGKILYGPGKQ